MSDHHDARRHLAAHVSIIGVDDAGASELTREDKTLSVPCPTCEAPAGEPCDFDGPGDHPNPDARPGLRHQAGRRP